VDRSAGDRPLGGANDAAATSTVIIRLVRNCAQERMIQYSRDVGDEMDKPQVLDLNRLRREDGGAWASSSLSLRMAELQSPQIVVTKK
jgi:hypothetical protein